MILKRHNNLLRTVLTKSKEQNSRAIPDRSRSRSPMHQNRLKHLFSVSHVAISALVLTVFGTSALAQQLIYDGTSGPGTAPLVSFPSPPPSWTGLSSIHMGAFYFNGSTVTTNADLLINYSSGAAPDFVIGGHSDNGSAVSYNKVTLQQGVANGPVYAGLSHVSEEKNTTTGLSSGDNTSAEAVISRTSSSAHVDHNDVIVHASSAIGTATGNIYGGYATVWGQAGDANAGGNATGGFANSYAMSFAFVSLSTVTAGSNSVTIDSGSDIHGDLYGGYASLVGRGASAQAGDANATASTSTSSSSAEASGYASTVKADSNKVTTGNNSSLTGSIHGGYASLVVQAGSAIAGDSIGGGTLSTSATGANTDAFNSIISADSNIMTIGGNTAVAGNLYGGYANIVSQGGHGVAGNLNAVSGHSTVHAYATATGSMTADNNTMTVGDDSTITGNIYGGYVDIAGQGGYAKAGDATGTGTSNNNIAHAYARSYVHVSSSTITADGNKVTIGEGAYANGKLYGGYVTIAARGGYAESGSATSVTTSVDAFSYAFASVVGSTVTASSNAITIGKTTLINGSIHGGYAGLSAEAGHAIGGYENGSLAGANARVEAGNAKVFANTNKIILNGALQNGSIYGGHVDFDITPGTATLADGVTPGDNGVDLTGSHAQAIDNVVTFGDTARINGTVTSLYGGYLQHRAGFAPESYDVFTGNILNYSVKALATVQTIANFEYYNFTLNPAYANNGTVLITAQDIELGANPSNVSSGAATPSKIAVVGIHAGNALNVDDKFILMQAASLTGNGVGLTTKGVAQQGISLLYNVRTDVDFAGNQVTATILGEDPIDNGSGNNGGSGGNGSGGPAARVNPQLKALSEGYLSGLMLVTRGADVIANDLHGTIERQNKGGLTPFILISASHNRYNSGSHIKSDDFLLTGGISYRQKDFTLAAFIEAGWGNYDSYNSFYNAAAVRGDGNNSYVGGGVFGHYEFDNGLYAEASFRAGQSRSKFDTTDIQNLSTGEFAHDNLKSPYMSAHVGAGYLWTLSEANTLDLSAKYLWSRLGSKSATIGGDAFHFDRINSQRLRLNGELKHRYSDTLTVFAGLGYEYEFDAEAKATTYGVYRIDAPKLKGATGILSLGATITSAADKNLSFDVKAQGYVGKREGGSATARVNYAF